MMLGRKNKRNQFEIEIPEPCDMAWDEMDDWSAKARFCRRCDKSVHNLSALTEAEAHDLLERTGWQACVNFEVDDEGKVVYRKPAPSRLERQIEGAMRLVAAAAVALPLAACSVPAEAPMSAPIAVSPIVVKEDTVAIVDAVNSMDPATRPRPSREFVSVGAAQAPRTFVAPKPATGCEEPTGVSDDRDALFATAPAKKIRNPVKAETKDPPKKDPPKTINVPKIPPKRLGGRPAKVHFPMPKRIR
jgi:hypothetical protein